MSRALTEMMGDVATELLGAPNPALSKLNEGTIRFGSRGSIEVNLREGWFSDYETGAKGGVLALIKHKGGAASDAAALRWLEDKGIKDRDIDPVSSGRTTRSVFYDYRDESSQTVFRIERSDGPNGKSFRQHGPDGNGGFVSRRGCMQGVKRVPYRLPELLAAAPDQIVFVCEGEKDADRLAKSGLVATTNAGGAGKFEQSLAPYFKGRSVVVLPDNDKPGHDHALDVRDKLRDLARTVAVLALPGLAEKGDVSDWLASGHTKDELVKLAVQALASVPNESTPTGTRPAYLRGVSAAALLAKEFAPVNFVIPGLLAEGVTILAGPPKLGKSWLSLDFAEPVASGRPVFGSIPVTQGDVLYLALEDSERRLKSRLLKRGGRNCPERLTLVTEWPDLDHGCINELEAWADAVERPTLVIIDVLKMIRGQTRSTESLYESDYRALTGLGRFARERGIAVVVVHHVRKMVADDPLESISGTNGLTGAADTVMVLKRDNGTGHATLYVRGRDVEEAEKAVQFDRELGTWKLLGASEEVGRTNERDAILQVLRRHGEPMKARDVADIIGKNDAAVRKTLARMWDAGEVDKTARGMYTCPNSPNVPTYYNCDIETHGTWGVSSEEDYVQIWPPEEGGEFQ